MFNLLRPVLFVLGVLLGIMGGSMLLPAAVDAAAGNPDWVVFVTSAAFVLLLAGMLISMTYGPRIQLDLRQGFLLTTLSWIALSAAGALPLVFSELDLSYTDAFFEAISGLTTTGSTVLNGLDFMPPGILLWRAVLQWQGGIGIIVMAIAMLPYLRVGGMQLFRMESSDRSDKVLPRAGQLATATTGVYLLVTAGCIASYYAAGMSGFNAFAHAFTTVSTGGYSTYDASLGHFTNPAIHWIATFFMVLGALPFALYIRAVRGDLAIFWRDSQPRRFLIGLGVVILAMTAWLWLKLDFDVTVALRLAAFNVVSIVTTTGYAIADYGQWAGLTAVFFLLTFLGGCTGSTSGGIKTLRFELAGLLARRQMLQLLRPHGVYLLHYRGRTVPRDVSNSVLIFLYVFGLSFAFLSIALALAGLDFTTAISGAATALANVGPGLGNIIGPAGNFSTLPDTAKWLLSGGMLLGRLEFFTVLVILTPAFWHY